MFFFQIDAQKIHFLGQERIPPKNEKCKVFASENNQTYIIILDLMVRQDQILSLLHIVQSIKVNCTGYISLYSEVK